MGNWESKDIVAFTFLFLGCLLVISLLRSLIKLVSYEWQEGEFSIWALIKMFATTLVSLILLLIFIFLVMPNL